MATFNGLDIFGVVISTVPRPNPARVQLNSFPGVDGRELLRQGSAGGRVVVVAMLVAETPADLEDLEATFIALQATATLGVLVDESGRAWEGCFLAQYEPAEEIRPAPAGF